MLELLAFCAEPEEFRAIALRQDGVAGVAVVGLDQSLPVFRFMSAVMATETARPILVAEVVRIYAPVGFHRREQVVSVALLRDRDPLTDPRVILVAIGQNGGDASLSLRFSLVRASEDVNRICLDIRQRAIEVTQCDGQVDSVVWGRVPVGGPVMAIHAVHFPNFGSAAGVTPVRVV